MDIVENENNAPVVHGMSRGPAVSPWPPNFNTRQLDPVMPISSLSIPSVERLYGGLSEFKRRHG